MALRIVNTKRHPLQTIPNTIVSEVNETIFGAYESISGTCVPTTGAIWGSSHTPSFKATLMDSQVYITFNESIHTTSTLPSPTVQLQIDGFTALYMAGMLPSSTVPCGTVLVQNDGNFVISTAIIDHSGLIIISPVSTFIASALGGIPDKTTFTYSLV